MPDDREVNAPENVIGSPRSDVNPEPGEQAGPVPDPDNPVLEIVIERDLAVQVIGSDAGRCRRIKPHSSMTKGASQEECADVSEAMSGFLNDEIRRVHQDRTHRPRTCTVAVTPRQASALASFCRRYAAFLLAHIEKHPGDENLSRSQQRRNQALRVLSQIDAALGIPEADGTSKDQVRREVIAQAERLNAALAVLKEHAETVIDPANASLLELKEKLQLCLSRCGRSR